MRAQDNGLTAEMVSRADQAKESQRNALQEAIAQIRSQGVASTSGRVEASFRQLLESRPAVQTDPGTAAMPPVQVLFSLADPDSALAIDPAVSQ